MTLDPMRLVADLGRLLGEVDLRDGELARSLDRAAETAVAIFGVDGAGLMLRVDDGELRLIGASDDSGKALELAQQRLDDGPGLEAMRRGAVVSVDDLERSGRWSALWQLVSPHDVRAVLSAPIALRGRTAGNFNLFSHHPRAWEEHEKQAIVAYAGVLTAMLRIGLEADFTDPLITRLRAGLEDTL
jgi:GAF domain-containing protein